MSVVTDKSEAVSIVKFSFSVDALDGEPDLDGMDEVVGLVEKVMGDGIPLGIRTEQFNQLPMAYREEHYVLPLKVTVIQQVSEKIEAAALASQKAAKKDNKESLYDAQAMYCALYVFAMFRFGLTVKDLAWLSKLTGMYVTEIRNLHNAAQRLRSSADWKKQ